MRVKHLLVWYGLAYTTLWLGWQHTVIGNPVKIIWRAGEKAVPQRKGSWSNKVNKCQLGFSFLLSPHHVPSPPLPCPPLPSPSLLLLHLTSPSFPSSPLSSIPFSFLLSPSSPIFLFFSFFFKLICGGRTYQLWLRGKGLGRWNRKMYSYSYGLIGLMKNCNCFLISTKPINNSKEFLVKKKNLLDDILLL